MDTHKQRAICMCPWAATGSGTGQPHGYHPQGNSTPRQHTVCLPKRQQEAGSKINSIVHNGPACTMQPTKCPPVKTDCGALLSTQQKAACATPAGHCSADTTPAEANPTKTAEDQTHQSNVQLRNCKRTHTGVKLPVPCLPQAYPTCSTPCRAEAACQWITQAGPASACARAAAVAVTPAWPPLAAAAAPLPP